MVVSIVYLYRYPNGSIDFLRLGLDTPTASGVFAGLPFRLELQTARQE